MDSNPPRVKCSLEGGRERESELTITEGMQVIAGGPQSGMLLKGCLSQGVRKLVPSRCPLIPRICYIRPRWKA